MGSQGILKTTDGGAHWTVIGANVFGPAYPGGGATIGPALVFGSHAGRHAATQSPRF